MKRIWLIGTAIVYFAAGNAQQKNDLTMAADFKSLSTDFKSVVNLQRSMQTTEAFQSYKSSEVLGSQFYAPEWCEGSVTTTNGEVINGFLFMYDKVRQELFIRKKDSNLVAQAEKSQVKSFTLNTGGQQHLFGRGEVYGSLLAGNFIEVLSSGGKYSLLKLTKTEFQKADNADMLKVRNGEAKDAFVDQVTYYVFQNNTLTKITLREKAVRKALSAEQTKVDAFFNAHKGEDCNEQLIAKLIAGLN